VKPARSYNCRAAVLSHSTWRSMCAGPWRAVQRARAEHFEILGDLGGRIGSPSRHVNALHVVDGARIVDVAPTYRGEGKAFR
jgi:hypothetical protein